MFTLALSMILVVLLVPYPVNAQQAEAPVYKDGDWWRVKVDLSRPAGVSVAPGLEQFPEYIVKFESGKPIVLGIRGSESKQIAGALVLAMVLGRGEFRGDLLRFPMRLGLTWSGRVNFQPPGMQMRSTETQYEVQTWEKLKTAKGEFDAFRLEMNMIVPRGPKRQGPTEFRPHTYFYAPEIKAIVSYQELGSNIKVTSTLVDFNLAQ